MSKITKVLRGTLVLGMFLSVNVQKAEAFGFFPPTPPEPVVDFPDELGKVFSVAQAYYQKAQAIQSQLSTLKLDAIKKGDVFALKEVLSAINGKGQKKAPNKGAIQASPELGLTDEKLLDEKALFNAHDKLFFKYPSLTDYDKMFAPDEKGNREADYAAMQTAYDRKGAIYRQDMLIDTHLTARVIEDYLVTVERTINRLDACQKQPDENHCTFFGYPMEKVESLPEAPGGGGDDPNPGQIGAAKNAYIVTMVYDRLMRIVEDLTATEALYQSAKQTDMADPVQPKGSNSSAEDYLPTKYQFVYTTMHKNSYAKLSGGSLLNKEGADRTECTPSDKDPSCPPQNKNGKNKKLIEDTEILKKIQPIDILVREAINIHNAKNQMPSYKTEYRKYLRAIAIHKRALQAVYDSDQCVVKFLNAHSANSNTDWATKWGAAKGTSEEQINDYDSRSGSISHAVLSKYQDRTTDTILGTSSACDGYYPEGQCADGYKTDTEHPCENDPTLFPCLLENGVTFNYTDEVSSNELDYVSNAEDVENIATDNRIHTEWSWRIGADAIMDLTKRKELKFNPWNDQKQLQTQYLRQKYKNISNIIKTTDQSLVSYKVAKALGDKSQPDDTDAAIQTEIQQLIKGAVECKTAAEAENDVIKDKCGSQYLNHDTTTETVLETEVDDDGNTYEVSKTATTRCETVVNLNQGTVSYKKIKELDGEETILASGVVEQIVSSSGDRCEYKTGNTSTITFSEDTGACPGTWNLTKSFLVRKYIPAELGACETDGATKFAEKEDATNRLIARNKLAKVIEQRRASDTLIRNMIEKYNNDQDKRQKELKNIKQQMTSYNRRVDDATKEKNILVSEIDKTTNRISSIETEINNINDRKAKTSSKEDICFMDYQIMKLENEKSCISGQGGTSITCPSSCGNVKEKKKPGVCKGEAEAFACDDADKGYTTTVSKMLNAKTAEEQTSETTKVAKLYLVPSEAEAARDAKQNQIDVATQIKKSLQENADAKQKEIDDAAEAFTMSRDEGGKHVNEVGPNEQASYIVTVEDEQGLIEKANEEFEKFLADFEEKEGLRMWDKEKEHCTEKVLGICIHHDKPTEVGSDNLATTLKEFFDYDNDLAKTIKAKMEAKWVNSAVAQLSAAVSDPFVIDSSFYDKPLSLGSDSDVTLISMAEIIEQIKEQIVKAAAEQVAQNITRGDTITKDELISALKEVKKMTDDLGISEDEEPSVLQQGEISDHNNYGVSSKKITHKHENLITALRVPTAANASILNDAGVNLGELFGIGEDIEKTTDEEYFVALPARGVNYAGDNTLASDANAGRDFIAPREPLLNLPPLREVFYFDAQDFKEIPTKNGRVAIAYLLDKKFPSVKDAGAKEWEYMPEVWRYLLARPNVRNDQKYQQTFVERSYKAAELKNLVGGDEKNNGYRTLIARNGAYPCKLSGSGIIDVTGGSDVGGMKFIYGLNSIKPVTQSCKEIALNGLNSISENAVSKENLCHLYNSRKSGICHLLANHGKNEDTQTSLGRGNVNYFDDYSELGQFLKIGSHRIPGIEDTSAYYRDLQKNIADYLSSDDDDDMKNDINRQKAELAAFRRNLIGSFINTVKSEQQAKKTRDNMKASLLKSLTNLCSQVHENGESVSSNLNDEKYLELDKNAQDALNNECAQYLVEGEGKSNGTTAVGLAAASIDKKDTKYGMSEEFTHDSAKFGGLSCGASGLTNSYYEHIFCILDNLKDKKLHDIEAKLSELKGMKGADAEYVKERIDEIENLRDMLKQDKNEVVFITPNMKKENIESEITKARTDRTAERISDEESITGMDNGSQVVPYCPVY